MVEMMSSGGTAKATSHTNPTMVSAMPPTYPASMPKTSPQIAPMRIATRPTVALIIAPRIVLVNTSRPRPSVPNGWVRLGIWLIAE